MKMEKFTTAHLTYRVSAMFLSMLLLLGLSTNVNAQCPLAANDLVNISMGDECFVEVTPDMVLEAPGDGCDYQVKILFKGRPVAGLNTVRRQHIGHTLTVEVSNVAPDGAINKTWGKIKIEDKKPPVIECEDEELFCFQEPTLPVPVVTDNCTPNPEIITVSDEVTTYECNEDPTYSAKRVIKYQAVDEYGNRSEVCEKTVMYLRINEASLMFPPNYDDTDEDALKCTNNPKWDHNGNNYPDADEKETGTPFVAIGTDTFYLYPDAKYCKVNITFNDTKIDICESSYKILRKWTVLFWCSGNVVTENQVIKVVDDNAPVFETEGRNFTTSVTGYECDASWRVVKPVVKDSCSSFKYEVQYVTADEFGNFNLDGFTGENVSSDKKSVINKLPLGKTLIKYIAIDDCGNTSSAIDTLTVIDEIAPHAICKEFTVVSLTNEGTARVYAESFDDESYDNCHLKTRLVRRMNVNPDCECELPEFEHMTFKDSMDGKYYYLSNHKFSRHISLKHIEALGGTIVDLTKLTAEKRTKLLDTNRDGVVDGNDEPIHTKNSTHVGEYKYLVYFNTKCGFSTHVRFCCDDINEENMVVFRVVDHFGNWNECMVNAKIEDKLDPYITCKDVRLECSKDINNFKNAPKPDFGDNCMAELLPHEDLDSLNQCGTGVVRRKWTVKDKSGRTATCIQRIEVYDNDPFDESDITWPDDVNFDGCMVSDTDPDKTGRPTYDDDHCSLVAATYEDKVFTFADGACFKILRVWTVIDWCTYKDHAGYKTGYWEHTQIIKVNNKVKPVFANCKDKDVDIFDADCDGDVTFETSATDDCTKTEDLVFHHEIYTYVNGKKGRLLAKGKGKAVVVKDLKPGQYTVYWTVEDQCGNIEYCHEIYTVRDKKKPTPYCYGDIRTVIMPSTGMIDIWASDFNKESYDNCEGELKFSFSKDVKDTRRVFTCAEVGTNVLDVWVTDASDNQDYCTVTLNVQPNKACGSGRVSGKIMTEGQRPVGNVVVSLSNRKSAENTTFMTNDNGSFQFLSLTKKGDYMVLPSKDDNHRNGVNTRDLLAIQRHILGIKKFKSPYKMIAADANRDERISSKDLLEMRKVILKINTKFTKNKSWRFVGSDYRFKDINRPYVFDEEVYVDELNENAIAKNFIAMKIGDVDESSVTRLDGQPSAITRSSEALELAYADKSFQAGESVSIPVYANTSTEISGLQLELEAKGLEIVDVEAGSLDIVEGNFAINDAKLALSWNTVYSEATTAGEVLFTIIARATTSSTTLASLSLNQDDLNAEAYDADLAVMNVALNARGEVAGSNVFEVTQNTPNPFLASTSIDITIPQAGNVKLDIYNVTGKQLFSQEKQLTEGKHTWTVRSESINASGVLYYKVSYGDKTITNKMIAITK